MDVLDRIKTTLDAYPIVLFMKGTPTFPMCAYSSRAVTALRTAGAHYHSVNILEDPQIRAAMKAFANWPTFPQLFIQGELIGGCDIIEELLADGELARIAADLGEAGT